MCEYLNIYDNEKGELTEWGKRVRRNADGKYSDDPRSSFEFESNEGRGQIIREFLEETGMPEDLFDSELTQLRMKKLIEEYSIDITEGCPHDTHPESDYCVYHLSLDRMEELGIEPETVRSRFKEDIKDPEKPNKFTGAKLETIDLSSEIIDLDNRNPIRLDFAQIDRLDLRKATIKQGLEVNHAVVRTADMTQAKIQMDVSFEHTVFRDHLLCGSLTAQEGEVRFNEAVVCATDEIISRGVRRLYEQIKTVGNPTGPEDVYKHIKHLEGSDVWISKFFVDQFSEPTDFVVEVDELLYEEYADELGGEELDKHPGGEVPILRYHHVLDYMDSVGWGNVIRGVLDASRTPSPRSEYRAEFEGCQFNGKGVYFREAGVGARADFGNAAFGGHEAEFSDTVFYSDIGFEGSTFVCDRADFSGCEFEGRVAFRNTKFESREVNFNNITSYKKTSFEDVEFDNAVTFRGANLGEEATQVLFNSSFFREDAPEFKGVKFSTRTEFTEAVFNKGVNFEGANFCDEAYFGRTTYLGDRPSFNGTKFEGEAIFRETIFENGLEFRESRFEKKADFRDMRVSGRKTKFGGSTFCSDADFKNCSFEMGAKFTKADFHSDVSFRRCSFNQSAEFNDVDFERRPSFRYTEYGGSEVTFTDAEFKSGADFEETHFRSRETDFRDAEFISIQDSDFENKVSFKNSEFENTTANFSGSEFRDGDVVFRDSTFSNSELKLDNAEFYSRNSVSQNMDFRDMEILEGELLMREVVSVTETYEPTKKGMSFRRSGFPEQEILKKIEDKGGSVGLGEIEEILESQEYPSQGEDPILDASGKKDILDYLEKEGFVSREERSVKTQRRSDELNEKVEVIERVENGSGGEVEYGTAKELAERNLLRVNPHDSKNPIDLSGSYIESGMLSQPGVTRDGVERNGEAGEITIYQMEGCTVGDVDIRARDRDQSVFDCFIFLKTKFDGFDFKDHSEELAECDWRIHRGASEDNQEASLVSKVKNKLLLRPSSETIDAADEAMRAEGDVVNTLEMTYMNAKNGADMVGANKAASKFFQKELAYRRLNHQKEIDTEALSTKDSFGGTVATLLGELLGWAKRKYRYISNLLLGITTGYGEQPRRVITVSLATIAAFGVIFYFVWLSSPGSVSAEYSGAGGALLLSIESFTTLVLGGGDVGNAQVRMIGYAEGFIGAFLIALFVFTLTRSVHR